MNITDIISVSPVNPAHGRHEVHARTNESIDIAFQISPDALGCLTGYFDTFTPGDAAYAKHRHTEQKAEAQAKNTKGS